MYTTLTSLGAVSDARELRDVSMAASSNVLNSASANFIASDVGKHVVVAGAAASGAKLCTTIFTFVTESQVTLSAYSSTAVSNAGAVFGTDCSPAFQDGIDNIITDRGGTLVIDGLFLLATPMVKQIGGETAGIAAKITGYGSDSAIWIGTAGSVDAISLTSGAFEFQDVNFVGVPGASRDARRVINLLSTEVLFDNCGFYGLMCVEALIYASQSFLDTIDCLSGGCFVASGPTGYNNCVIENKNWYKYRDQGSQFIDFGYFRGLYYSKSGFSSTLGWVRADTANGSDGARGESVFELRGTVLDEGSLYGVVIKPSLGTIAHARLSGIRQNITSADTGRGIQCYSVTSFIMEQSWQGWSSNSTLVGSFQDCGTVLIDGHKVSDSVNTISATNCGSLTLRDSPGITIFNLVNTPFHPQDSKFGNIGKVKDGPISDADFPAPPALGTLGFDRENDRLYIKGVSSGGWLYLNTDGGDLLGPELVVNGTFETNANGWTPGYGATLSAPGGVLRVTDSDGNGARAYQAISTVIGQVYRVTATVVAGGTAAGIVRVGNTEGEGTLATHSGVGTLNTTFTATNIATYITLMANSSVVGKYCDFDNVSLRAV